MSEQVEPKSAVLMYLKHSSQALGHAYNTGIEATPLAQDLPVFQKMLAYQREINQMMLDVSKLRGL